MQIFYWILLLVVVGIAIFAVQNSNVPLIPIKFLLWQFKTSLIYTILGSIGLGILMILFLWIPRAVKTSIRSKELRKQIKHLEAVLNKPKDFGQEGDQSKGL